MPRKASHGWSFRQQGGFRSAGPVKNILSSGAKNLGKKKKASPINQALSLSQAAQIGAMVSSICSDCGRRTEQNANQLLKKFSNKELYGLAQLAKKSKCSGCQSKRIELKYKLNKKFQKYAKQPSKGVNLLQDEAWLEFYSKN